MRNRRPNLAPPLLAVTLVACNLMQSVAERADPPATAVPAPATEPPPAGEVFDPTAPPQPSAGDPTPAVTPAAIEADLFVDDDSAGGAEDGSAQHPFATLQAAIDVAGDGQVIAVAAGTYPENVRVQDKAVELYGGYAGGAGGDFTARDPEANVTHLLGDGEDAVVTLLNAGTSVVDGFLITGGSRSVAELPWYFRGGGVYASGGAPTIAHNVIEDNDARTAAPPDEVTSGGGIFAGDSDISILDNLIRDNSAGHGAGIAIAGGSVVVRGNTVQENVGDGDHGGGLYIAEANAEVVGNLIARNEVGRDLGYGWGGGLIAFGAGAQATLSFNVVTGNYAPSIGSGVFIDDGAQAVLEHELIYGNECADAGGAGVYVDGAGEGGPGEPGSTVSISHSTVAGHDCAGEIVGNGLFVEGNSTVAVLNSILWGNGGSDFWAEDGSQLTVTYTLSEEGAPGTGNLSADPLFVDAARGDYHLGPGSPAVDAGDPASPFAEEPEPSGGRANLGAYGNTADARPSG
jgi:hypothetical protein